MRGAPDPAELAAVLAVLALVRPPAEPPAPRRLPVRSRTAFRGPASWDFPTSRAS